MSLASDKTDEDLLRAFHAGRRDALGELAERYELSLLGLASGLLGGRRDLACDAVQDTWLRVIRFSGTFTGQSSVKTWLYRVLVNRCRDLHHKRSAVRGIGSVPEGCSAAPDASTRIGDRLEQADLDRSLYTALMRLGDEKRGILLLCYHDGLSHAQAAEILKIPTGTLKSRLHAALVELRDALREHHEEPAER
jgi:RNA polymerase sigma-70 factor (ECF subfamily)